MKFSKMRYIITITVIMFAFSSKAQNITKLEKQAKKVVKSLQSENEDGYKKLIISQKSYTELTNHFIASRGVENINTDSMYSALTKKSINSYLKKVSKLKQDSVILDKISFKDLNYKIIRSDNEVKADVEILVNTNKGEKSIKTKYIYFNKKWGTMGYIGSIIDLDRICECVEKMTLSKIQDPQCMVYLNSLDPIIQALPEAEKEELMNQITACMKDYSEEKTEKLEVDSNSSLTHEQKEKIKYELEKAAPNYCDCIGASSKNVEPTKECKEMQTMFKSFVENQPSEVKDYIFELFKDCLPKTQ